MYSLLVIGGSFGVDCISVHIIDRNVFYEIEQIEIIDVDKLWKIGIIQKTDNSRAQ